MPTLKSTEKCNRCQNELNGVFCANCGHPKHLQRIDHKYILTEIGSVFNFDKGILFTIRELLLRPGSSIRKFIQEDRNHLVKPIIFLIITSLIFSVSLQLTGIEDGYINFNAYNWDNTVLKIMFQWISKNYGYINILIAVFIALWIKILFRKYAYNYYEILILLLFIMGMVMLFYTVFGIIEGLTNWQTLQFGVNLGFMYSAWTIGQFFDSSKWINYLKGFMSYILGFISFVLAILIIGFLIDCLMSFRIFV